MSRRPKGRMGESPFAHPVRIGRAAAIRNWVAQSYRIPVEAIAGPSRERGVVWPRQVAMWLIHEHLDLTLTEIGSLFDGRDHSTVISTLRKVQRRIAADAEVEGWIADMGVHAKTAADDGHQGEYLAALDRIAEDLAVISRDAAELSARLEEVRFRTRLTFSEIRGGGG